MATLLAILACAAALYGQAGKAELVGVLRDPGGLPVPNAVIELIDHRTGATVSARSNDAGAYYFTALSTGAYAISVTKAGFPTLRRDGVVLRVGDRIQLDLVLALGDASQTVVVFAEAPLLRDSRGTASFVVERKKVVALPLDGRNFVPLIALAPGVTLPPGGLLPRINGSRPRVSEYLYDGISVLQPEPGQVAYYPIVDAIEEFRVETNSPSAEFGRSNGGVILVNQKSGSNTLHGTVFEFFRNEALNARNLFATAGPKPRFRRNQHGIVLGGPIRRNRAFFFADWQGTRFDTGVVRTSTVPPPRSAAPSRSRSSIPARRARATAPTSATRSRPTRSPRLPSMPPRAPRSTDIPRPTSNRARTIIAESAPTRRRRTSSTSASTATSPPVTAFSPATPFFATIRAPLRRFPTAAALSPRPTSAARSPAATASPPSIHGRPARRASTSFASASRAAASTALPWPPDSPPARSRASPTFPSPPSRTSCRPMTSSASSNSGRPRALTLP
jgi:hypothetical protein